ncbi:MAG: LacI family DNA-binding transcriptional regulator [Cyclobacteriaceae bacterium]
MEKKKVTIHDIAKRLNIDSSTVSRALSGSPRVKEQTKKSVLALALELGYQPNIMASNLRKKKSNTIGVVVPRISRHFFASVIAAVDEVTHQAGYNVIICQSLDELEREKKLINTLLTNQVDGVLISISMESIDVEHLRQLESNGIPLVLFDRGHDSLQVDKVVIDDVNASFSATEHLIKSGCKRIVHFSGPQEISIYKDRLAGYKKALSKYDISLDESLILTSRLMSEDGEECAIQILEMAEMPDGIFSANDNAAIGAMKHLISFGVKIPEDMAIVGFSNEPISSAMEPSLTTIDQPGYEIGKKASEIILQQIESKSVSGNNQTIVVDADLLIRKSSMK